MLVYKEESNQFLEIKEAPTATEHYCVFLYEDGEDLNEFLERDEMFCTTSKKELEKYLRSNDFKIIREGYIPVIRTISAIRVP